MSCGEAENTKSTMKQLQKQYIMVWSAEASTNTTSINNGKQPFHGRRTYERTYNKVMDVLLCILRL